MTDKCSHLKSNPEAYRLCEFVINKRRIPTAQLDIGTPYIDFLKANPKSATSSPIPSTVRGTKRNNRFEPGEIYSYALRLIDSENMSKGNSVTSPNSLSRILTGIKSFRPPFILNDFDGTTTDDAKLVSRIRTQIANIKKTLVRQRLKPGTKKFNLALAHQLIAFVLRAKRSGGLGIIPLKIAPEDVKQQRSALEVFRSQNLTAHCAELPFILYPIFKMAGLKPKFLLVYENKSGTTSLAHICIGIQLDPSNPKQLTTVDLTMSSLSNWPGLKHKKVVPLPLLTVMAIHFHNKGVAIYNSNLHRRLTAKMRTTVKAHFSRAMQFDPRYPLFHANLAVYFKEEEKNTKSAKVHITRALKLYPEYEWAKSLRGN